MSPRVPLAARLGIPEPDYGNAEEYLKGLPEAQARAQMGSGMYDEWSAGRVNLKDLTTTYEDKVYGTMRRAPTLAEVQAGNIGRAQTEALVRQAVTVPQFQTPADAEQWIRDNLISDTAREAYVKSVERGYQVSPLVSMRGMDSDMATQTARAIQTNIERGIPKPDRILVKRTKDTWVARMSNTGDLELNATYVKNARAFAATTERAKDMYSSAARADYDALRLAGNLADPKVKRAVSVLEEHFKYNRYTVGNTYEDLITHELGHHLDNRGASILGIERQAYRKLANSAVTEMAGAEYRYKLSEYAFSNSIAAADEIFAESYAAYVSGERGNLSPLMLDLLGRMVP